MDGDSLKIIRKGYKLSQAEMAAKMEVSRQSYIAWEKNKYRIPPNIVDKLVAGGVAMPAQVEDANAIITAKNHPECFIEEEGERWYSLAHPRWYASGDCPLRHKVPEAMRGAATVAELKTYVPIAMETVVDLFLQNWPTPGELARYPNNGWLFESQCKGYLKRHGRADLLPLIPHDPTNDTDRPKSTTPVGDPPQELIDAFNSAFFLTNSNQET